MSDVDVDVSSPAEVVVSVVVSTDHVAKSQRGLTTCIQCANRRKRLKHRPVVMEKESTMVMVMTMMSLKMKQQ